MRLNNNIHNAVNYILLDVAFASRYIVRRHGEMLEKPTNSLLGSVVGYDHTPPCPALMMSVIKFVCFVIPFTSRLPK